MITRHLCLLIVLAATSLFSCAHSRPGTERMITPLSDRAEAGYHYLLFEEHIRGNDFEKARVELEKAIALEPSAQLYLELANIYWRMNNVRQTRDMLNMAIMIYPDETQLYRSLASSYIAEARYDKAAESLNRALDRHSPAPDLVKEFAAVSIQGQLHAKAKDMLKRIPETAYDEELHYLMAQASSGLGQHQKAIEHLEKAVALDPEYIDALVELGYLFELENDFASAETIYERILDLGETSPSVRLRIISLNLKLNNPDKAFELVSTAPQTTDFLLEAGHVFLQEKFYAQARDIFTQLEGRENLPAVYLFYRSLLAFEGEEDLQEAVGYLQQIPPEDPLYQQALSFQGNLYLHMNQFPQALEISRKGQELFPEKPSFWLLEAALLQNEGDHAAALRTVDAGLEKFPLNTDLLYQKGIILEQEGQRTNALKVMEEVVTIEPDHTDALNFIGYTLADENRDLDRALVLIQSAIKNDPDNGYILDSLAWVHFKRGELELAWEKIQQAVSKVDSDPIIWEHYGDIAKAASKLHKARSAYEAALSLEPKDAASIRKKLDSL
ncbi:MAG: tetratricopeptide repeat protein [bacterium]